MKNNNLFLIGQPVGVCELKSLPLLKISQIENTMLFDEKRFIVGRILGRDESTTIRNGTNDHLLIVTISGFIISVHKDDIYQEPHIKMETFLLEQEYLYISQRIKPYNEKLVKNNDETWCIQL